MDRKGILEDLVRELTSLPGIGRKTAQRLAFHILKQPPEDAERLARAVLAVKERLGLCRQCRNLAEGELCDICRDPARDATRVVVVEDVTTLYAFERTGGYKGLYHVLAGALSPLDGVGPADIKAQDLVDRLARGKVEEVIIATSPTIEGEATRERHLRDEALTNPLVQEALSVFGGEVKEVRHSRAPLEPEGETGS